MVNEHEFRVEQSRRLKEAAKYAPEMVMETPENGMMQIKTINIENDTTRIEKELEGIKKELHTLNEILKHWSRR